MRHVRLALFLALLLPSAIATPANDAGSGAEAPNSEDVLFLVNAGTYAAELRKEDADWYTSYDGAGSLACVTLDAASDIEADASLVVRDAGARRVMWTTVAPGASAQLAQAVNSLDDARFGFENEPDPGSDRGAYTFTVDALGMGDFTSDANTGNDAPSDAAQAPVVGSGCVGGRLGLFDMRDSYRFSAGANDIVVMTFASTTTDIRLELVAADGSVLASILGGERVSVPLPQGGTYSMAAQSGSPLAASTPYMMGLAIGPPTQGCRPACLSS